MSHCSHDDVADPRNRTIASYVNGTLKGHGQASASPVDSAFIPGDGVWAGPRIVAGQAHLSFNFARSAFGHCLLRTGFAYAVHGVFLPEHEHAIDDIGPVRPGWIRVVKRAR